MFCSVICISVCVFFCVPICIIISFRCYVVSFLFCFILVSLFHSCPVVSFLLLSSFLLFLILVHSNQILFVDDSACWMNLGFMRLNFLIAVRQMASESSGGGGGG